MDNVVFVDYIVSKECKIEAFFYGVCYKCGQCGRVFDESGVMIDEGGTTSAKWEDMV